MTSTPPRFVRRRVPVPTPSPWAPRVLAMCLCLALQGDLLWAGTLFLCLTFVLWYLGWTWPSLWAVLDARYRRKP